MGKGPYLDAALICEDLIQEKDWTVSAIRLVNRLTLHDLTPEPGAVLVLPLFFLASFKAGEVTGEHELWLYWTSPSGKRRQMPGIRQPHLLTFQGGDTGALAAVPLFIRYEADGTYWLDVTLGKKRYSRVPLTLRTGEQPS
jgi:hypothetical protein